MVHPSGSLGASKLHQRPLPKHSLIASVHTQSPKNILQRQSRTSRTAFFPEQMCGLIAKALCPKVCRTPVQAMPVVPVTQQTEHRVKEQSLKHESPLPGADDFTLLVESDSKTKETVEERLLANAVNMPAKAVETEAHAMVTKLPRCLHLLKHWKQSSRRRPDCKTSEYGIVQLSGRGLRSQLKRDSLGSRCTLVSS